MRIWSLPTGACLRVFRGNSRCDPVVGLAFADEQAMCINTTTTMQVLVFADADTDEAGREPPSATATMATAEDLPPTPILQRIPSKKQQASSLSPLLPVCGTASHPADEATFASGLFSGQWRSAVSSTRGRGPPDSPSLEPRLERRPTLRRKQLGSVRARPSSSPDPAVKALPRRAVSLSDVPVSDWWGCCQHQFHVRAFACLSMSLRVAACTAGLSSPLATVGLYSPSLPISSLNTQLGLRPHLISRVAYLQDRPGGGKLVLPPLPQATSNH